MENVYTATRNRNTHRACSETIRYFTKCFHRRISNSFLIELLLKKMYICKKKEAKRIDSRSLSSSSFTIVTVSCYYFYNPSSHHTTSTIALFCLQTISPTLKPTFNTAAYYSNVLQILLSKVWIPEHLNILIFLLNRLVF